MPDGPAPPRALGGAEIDPREALEIRSREASSIDPREASRTGSTTLPRMDSGRLLREVIRYAADRKARDIVELDMREVVGYTDWFLICSGNSDRQVKAIHDAILSGCKRDHGILPARVHGVSQAQWVLMDYLDVVVHIFTPEMRELYRLEQLWGEAPAHPVTAPTR